MKICVKKQNYYFNFDYCFVKKNIEVQKFFIQIRQKYKRQFQRISQQKLKLSFVLSVRDIKINKN